MVNTERLTQLLQSLKQIKDQFPPQAQEPSVTKPIKSPLAEIFEEIKESDPVWKEINPLDIFLKI